MSHFRGLVVDGQNLAILTERGFTLVFQNSQCIVLHQLGIVGKLVTGRIHPARLATQGQESSGSQKAFVDNSHGGKFGNSVRARYL